MDAASITHTLLACRAGDPDALDRLFPLVYDELRRIAHGQLKHEGAGHTLGTTGLVHETYIKLVNERPGLMKSAGFFSGVTSCHQYQGETPICSERS